MDAHAGAAARRRAAASAQPNEIADAIVFLCSERAAFITGAALAIDGGTLRSIYDGDLARGGRFRAAREFRG